MPKIDTSLHNGTLFIVQEDGATLKLKDPAKMDELAYKLLGAAVQLRLNKSLNIGKKVP